MLLGGDTHLERTTDPDEPWGLIKDTLKSEDFVYANLEGAFYDEIDPYEYYHKIRWVHPPTAAAPALRGGNIKVVGLANNVIIGEKPIRSTLDLLDQNGIAHTGAGMNEAEARAPAIIESDGVRYGFLQRTSIFWPTHQRALPDGPVQLPADTRYLHGSYNTGETVTFHGAPGLATIRARTAFEPHFNYLYEGGGDCIVHSWPDPTELDAFIEDIKALRPQVDVLVTSHHWRLTAKNVARDYRVEIAHAAIDAGADMVASHGTHNLEEIEVYKGRVIFYGLGELLFRHVGGPYNMGAQYPRYYENGAPPGMALRRRILARTQIKDKKIDRVSAMFIGPKSKQDDRPVVTPVEQDPEGFAYLERISKKYGTKLQAKDGEIVVLEGGAQAQRNAPASAREPVAAR